MSDISQTIGEKIRLFRRTKNVSMDELADRLNKSRSTVAKYEQGTIVIDVETLYAIAAALDVSLEQLLPPEPSGRQKLPANRARGIFCSNGPLYLYHMPGKNIVINELCEITHGQDTDFITMYICKDSSFDKSTASAIYYGPIIYTDVYARFVVHNQTNPLDYLHCHVTNSFTTRGVCDVLMSSIANFTYLPFAGKGLLSTEPLRLNDELLERLRFSKDEIKYMKEHNVLLLTQK